MKKFFLLLINLAIVLLLHAQVNHLVISQVYATGGNSGATFNADFIELFNPSDAPVDLTGWSIQYSSASGLNWNARPLTGSIGVGKYFLIKMSVSLTNGVDLPTPDLIVTPLALAGGGGEVALVQTTTALPAGCLSNAAIVDLAGYGNAICVETIAAIKGANKKSVLRISSGCIDTDNNFTDFTLATPIPRNSATPVNICGIPVATVPISITPTSFIASWNVFTNATSYRLDVLKDGSSIDPEISVLAGWTFPVAGTIVITDISNNLNTTRQLSTNAGNITSAAGEPTKAASSSNWTNGINTKYWQISFNATGYSNITLSSQQSSSPTGPQDFKVQYRVGISGIWNDLSNSNLLLTENYPEATLAAVPLPVIVNNEPEIFIRWIMTSNINSNGVTVGSGGTSRIDNIFIRGNGTIPFELLPGYDNLTVNTTTKEVTDLTTATKYYYKVRASYDGSVSINSNIIVVNTESAIPLPVKFIHVKATTIEKGVEVTWANALETDVIYYDVERSDNGISFSSIMRVYPTGNNGNTAQYKWVDSNPATQNYYRIKAVELNEKSTSSIVVKAGAAVVTSVRFYPNPLYGRTFNMQLDNAPSGVYNLRVYNITGQNMYHTKIIHTGNVLNKSITLAIANPGMYVVEISGAVRLQKQLIVQ